MQLIESDGARRSPGAAASRVPQRYAQPSTPAGFTSSPGANASRFDEDAGAGATKEVVADARDLLVADSIVAQAVIAHSIVAESMAGEAGNSARASSMRELDSRRSESARSSRNRQSSKNIHVTPPLAQTAAAGF